ncbi:MAG: molybdopterin molybdotransferase MoeA [Robiginitomaculum sp.]|nr:molybdopterin molybdotransferase MoeA [Robiginitomaculum sp.]
MAKLISVSEALALITKTPISQETCVPLKEAFGHVLSQDVAAKVTLPPHNASAMDGYAVKLENHHKLGSKFTLIGEAPAGRPYEGVVGADETVRIFTGGAVPDGANHVIMQENVRANGDVITLTEPISPASHIRKAGIDFKTGDRILAKGTQIGAYELAILAAANCDTLPVTFAPKVALIANGDELVAPGKMTNMGQVISSNPYGLMPLLNPWGANTINMGISKDAPKAIRAQIARAVYQGADILVPIGGASVGDHDYMRLVFAELGYSKIFEKVAVKPGKPVWFGTMADQDYPQYVLGLPGNPASALVTAHLFLKPLIKALTGATTAHKFVNARITHPVKAATWRADYIRAHAVVDENGTLHVTAIPRQDSSLLTPFLTANCFLVREPQDQALEIGERAKIMLIKPFN